MNVEREEYTVELDRTVRVKMTIHSPDSIPNPEYDGVSLHPGYSYNYGIREFIVRVLPAPYKTQCKNYTLLKETRTGAIQTQEDCLSECAANLHMKHCNCTVLRLSLIHNIQPCLKHEKKCLDLCDSYVKDVCSLQCQMACIKTTYPYEAVDSTELNKDVCNSNSLKETISDTEKKNLICLKVFFVTADSEIYTHTPMYNGVQVFSVIGGYIGLWLGVSLLDILGHLIKIAFACIMHKKEINPDKNECILQPSHKFSR